MHSFYLDAIRNFEGFTPEAAWDYAQFSNGYGTRARYAGEVIDRAEAERRFRSEISEARAIVDKAAPHVDEGTKAALTSLTYNAGTAWIKSGLGEAVRAGDLETAREIFQKYNKAGGEVLPGLVRRRTEEALWIGNPEFASFARASGSAGAAAAAFGQADGSGSQVADADLGAQRVADLIQRRTARAARAAEAVAATEKAQSERVATTMAETFTGAASGALLVLAEADRLTSERVADLARLAQLTRGSELARASRDRQDDETRRV